SPPPLGTMNETDPLESASSALIQIPLCALAALYSALMVAFLGYAFARKPRLREQWRYVLFSVLSLSQGVYFVARLVQVCLSFFQKAATCLDCAALFMIQRTATMAEMTALTAMSVDRYLAICWPLRYGAIFTSLKIWHLMAGFCFCSAITPSSIFIVRVCFLAKRGLLWRTIPCSKNAFNQLGVSGTVSVSLESVQFGLYVLIIFASYFLVLKEGVSSRSVSLENARARRTILLHMVHLGFYLLPVPTYLIASSLHRNKVISTAAFSNTINVSFYSFTLAQIICPVIYSLRSDQLRPIL
uniref:G-protein coupled receptors family 1 profile domain-containing protein n=1 Tax=Latimeria chalumnae TaxID=7897 RepID=H3B6R2_LATCH